MMTDLTANNYAGALQKVPRAELSALLTQYEPEQPLKLAAYLNATPALTSLEQLTVGEVAAMTERLTTRPERVLKVWAALRDAKEIQGREGAAWLG